MNDCKNNNNNNLLNQLLITAEQSFNNSDFIAAYKIYHELISSPLNNSTPEIYNNLAITAYQLDKYQESIYYINKAITLEPNNPIYIMQYAQFIFTSDFSLSEQLFKTALKLTDNTTNKYIKNKIESNYANLLYNQGCIIAANPDPTQQTAAINLFTNSLNFNKNNYKAYYNMACCYINLNNLTSAIANFNKTIEINPDHGDAHFALSQFYQQNNNIDLAKQHLQAATKATEINKANAEYNYGVLEHKAHNFTQAITHYKNSININPKLFAASYNLASIYQKLKDYNNAITYYNKALSINPDDETCKYLLSSLQVEANQNITPKKAPDEYIEKLFDSYAQNFEYDLLHKLNYRTPELLYELFTKKITSTNLNILDLGCGTGLIGPTFKPIAKSITGVDLSQNMLDIAKTKSIYNNLIKSEINAFLENNLASNTNADIKNNKFDLIILSDVLVYYGDLDNLFLNIQNNLRNNGYLLFSIEELINNNNFKLTTNGRYAHSYDYINQIIQTNQTNQIKFNIIDYQKVTLRNQGEDLVNGIIFLLNLTI